LSDSSFAPPGSELGTPSVGTLQVAASPTAGQGLALDAKGKIPAGLVASTTMVSGTVGATGTITAGTGFSVTNPSTGVYNITFTKAMTSLPVVLVSGASAQANRLFTVSSIATTGFTVNDADSAATVHGDPFSFLAIQT
jgi:hypothetical protein